MNPRLTLLNLLSLFSIKRPSGRTRSVVPMIARADGQGFRPLSELDLPRGVRFVGHDLRTADGYSMLDTEGGGS